jgi:hypothetical protein
MTRFQTCHIAFAAGFWWRTLFHVVPSSKAHATPGAGYQIQGLQAMLNLWLYSTQRCRPIPQYPASSTGFHQQGLRRLLNIGESHERLWFVSSVSGAVLTGVLSATIMLSPVPRTLAKDAIGRLTATASATRNASGRRLAAVAASPLVMGPLNGEPTPRADAERRAIAVTIDNYYPSARPQTGLSDASVVFETLAEGGITRLMAIYLEHDPPVVGPVRSTRIYFDDWAGAYHAMLAHVGGNDDAQGQLWQMPSVYNLDEGAEPFMLSDFSPYFWRSAARSVPDNMYANVARLRAYAASHGEDWPYNKASLPHKQLAPVAARGRSGTLTINFVDPLFPSAPANPAYQVQYRFDRASDSYLRVVGGTPQIDQATRQPIYVRNVVVMHTGAGIPDLAAGTTVDAVSIPVIGSGTAEFYQDGRVERGIWRQKDALAPLQFLTSRGTPVMFNPGQTWIEVLPQSSTATWMVQ